MAATAVLNWTHASCTSAKDARHCSGVDCFPQTRSENRHHAADSSFVLAMHAPYAPDAQQLPLLLAPLTEHRDPAAATAPSVPIAAPTTPATPASITAH